MPDITFFIGLFVVAMTTVTLIALLVYGAIKLIKVRINHE